MALCICGIDTAVHDLFPAGNDLIF